MNSIRDASVIALGLVAAAAAYASCSDMKANCEKAYKLDMEACQKADATSKPNCVGHAKDAWNSCMKDYARCK